MQFLEWVAMQLPLQFLVRWMIVGLCLLLPGVTGLFIRHQKGRLASKASDPRPRVFHKLLKLPFLWTMLYYITMASVSGRDRDSVKQMADEELKEVAPGFVRAVTEAKQRQADYVLLSFRAFLGEPNLFYLACQYAPLRGVPVLIAPELTPGE